MSIKLTKEEEQEFYKKLGMFIRFMQCKYELDSCLINRPIDNDIKKLISYEMLCNYKKGSSRISFFKLLKLADYFKYDPHQFITEFVKYLKVEK